jgi:hypothetical protein
MSTRLEQIGDARWLITGSRTQLPTEWSVMRHDNPERLRWFCDNKHTHKLNPGPEAGRCHCGEVMLLAPSDFFETIGK